MLTRHNLRTVPSYFDRLWRTVLIVNSTLLLTACLGRADPDRMAVTQIPPIPKMQSTICIRSITGGEDNAVEYGRVETADFKDALRLTLRNAQMLASENECRYLLDANILGLSRPAIIGSNPEVISSINYKLYDKGGSPILLETVTSSYTSNMSDSLAGVTRLERASEGSIRANVTEFLQRLSKSGQI